MPQPKLCHGCGKTFTPDPATGGGAQLYCSMACALEAQNRNTQIVAGLKAAGFEQNAEVPNLWAKDGVSVSIEELMHHGLEAVLQRHRRIVAEKSRPGGTT